LNSKERFIVILLALLNFTHILDFMIMMPLGNILMPKWNINSSQFTLVVSCYSFASFISSFASIFFADSFDRKKLLLFAYIGFLLGTLMCVFANNYHLMIGARFITGLFGGLISAQVLSIVGDLIAYEKRGSAMGLLMGGFGLASVIGVPLGIYFANQFSWYTPFIFIVIMGVLLIPFLLVKIPKLTAHLGKKNSFTEKFHLLKSTFADAIQVNALIFSALLIVGHFIIIPLINPFMVYNVKIGIENTAFIYMFGGLASLLTASWVGKLADQYGKSKVFTISAIFSIVFVFLITNMPQLPLWLVITIFALWFSAATGRTVPGQAMITQAVPISRRGSFMSLNACAQSLAQAIGMVVSSIVTYSKSDFSIANYSILGLISSSLIISCIFLAKNLEKKILEKV
jgi:MFS transporter, DHA1 family, inner membrane transport protein